jgi:hypothetical protein
VNHEKDRVQILSFLVCIGFQRFFLKYWNFKAPILKNKIASVHKVKTIKVETVLIARFLGKLVKIQLMQVLEALKHGNADLFQKHPKAGWVYIYSDV